MTTRLDLEPATMLTDQSPDDRATSEIGPYFTIDRRQLVRNVQRMRDALPGIEIFYAVKANPEAVVLRTLADAGLDFEVASIYEIGQLTAIGVTPDRMAYGTAVKPAAHVRAAHQSGVRIMTVDSTAEASKVAAVAPGASVYVRVRVDDSQSTFSFGEKFGADIAEVAAIVVHLRALGLQCRGLSFHVGSQSLRPTAWADAIELVRPIYEEFAARSEALPCLNIGGGFPCQYGGETAPSIEVIGTEVTRALAEMPPVRLVAEPGRFLVASAATLTTTVVGRADRGGSPWLYLVAGCYNGLFESMAYQGRTAYPVQVRDVAIDGPISPFNLAGPTGDSADVIARGIQLPADLSEGSQLVFSNVGAYTMSLSVPFNGFPRPAIVVR